MTDLRSEADTRSRVSAYPSIGGLGISAVRSPVVWRTAASCGTCEGFSLLRVGEQTFWRASREEMIAFPVAAEAHCSNFGTILQALGFDNGSAFDVVAPSLAHQFPVELFSAPFGHVGSERHKMRH